MEMLNMKMQTSNAKKKKMMKMKRLLSFVQSNLKNITSE